MQEIIAYQLKTIERIRETANQTKVDLLSRIDNNSLQLIFNTDDCGTTIYKETNLLNKNKITRFPITRSQRRKSAFEDLVVERQISGRQLKFHKNSALLQDGEFVTVDIMTIQIEDDIESKKHVN